MPRYRTARDGDDDAVDAEEEEVGVLHHVAQLGVDQEHVTARGEEEHGAGGGQPVNPVPTAYRPQPRAAKRATVAEPIMPCAWR